MSAEAKEVPRDPAAEDSSELDYSAGPRILRFVGGFVLLVMAMLIGYRYAMNTDANVWYLFQVAKHTAWTLDVIGDEAEVEPFREIGVVARRRQMAEWEAIDRGAPSTPLAQDVDNRPFTPYESWKYEAESRIRNGGTIQEHGPIVRVILQKGLSTQQGEITMELNRLRSERAAGVAEHAARIAELESSLSNVQARIQSFPPGEERRLATRGRQFTFRVVPDCGAIPSMSIFLAAVLAFPTTMVRRAIGAVIGLALLYGINILRLATLGFIGAIDTTPGQKWFNFIHEYVWQGIFIVFVVAVWMLWIELVVKARRA